MPGDPYSRCVEEFVQQALTAGCSTVGEVLQHVRGAPPELVWQTLRRQNVRLAWEAETYAETVADDEVEPHLLDADWRFTIDTCSRLAALLAPFQRVLLLGTPSLYDILGVGRSVRPPHDVVLVDRLGSRGYRDCEFGVDVRHVDIRNENGGLVDACVFDAPWYPEEVSSWLRTAIRSVRDGGSVFFSLWPELTRPGANGERETLLSTLSSHGEVTIEKDQLAYRTPLFERIAYLARGISLPAQWRCGDLVRFQPTRKLTLPEPSKPTVTWHRYIFDRYQIAVKHSKQPAKAFRSWTLQSVSRREPGRASIDVWDSHNRVATVGATEHIIALLDDLCSGRAQDADLGLLLENGFLTHGIPSGGVKWLQLD